MKDIRARLEGTRTTLADKRDLSPLPRRTDGQLSACIAGTGIDRPLHTVSSGDRQDLLQRVFSRTEHLVRQIQPLCQFNPVLIHLHTNQMIGSHSLRQHQRRQSYRSKTGDENRIVSGNSDLFDGLIHRSESAGHLGAVLVSQFIRQCDQIFLLRQNIRSHTAVPLPSVSSAERTFTGNIISSPAVIADATARDMIDDHTVPFLKPAQTLSLFHDHSTGLMAGNHPRDIPLGAFARMFPVDTADITAADRRSLRPDQHFPVSRLRNFKLFHLHRAVAGQRCPDHRSRYHSHSHIQFLLCLADHSVVGTAT